MGACSPGPLGLHGPSRLLLLDRRFPADFEKLRICVQGAKGLEGDAALLESKLSYAAWLGASGLNSESLWDKIEWVPAPRCSVEDRSFGSVIIMGDLAKPEAAQQLTTRFQPAELHCVRDAAGVNCQSNVQTLGFGGPGGLMIYQTPPDRWVRVENNSPASVVLSPYVGWKSLDQDLASQPELLSRILEAQKRVSQLTYPECLSLVQALTQDKLEAAPDPTFQTLFEAFAKEGPAKLDSTYAPRYSAFHVLLHEIGHQFGMDHADNPNLDSQTGSVGNSRQRGNQWLTEVATMAYGAPYLYLTFDDRTGIADLALKLQSLLRERTRP